MTVLNEAPGPAEESVAESGAGFGVPTVKPARHVTFHPGLCYRTRFGRTVKPPPSRIAKNCIS